MEVELEINRPVVMDRYNPQPFEDIVKLTNTGWRGQVSMSTHDAVGLNSRRRAERVFGKPEPSTTTSGQAAWLCYVTAHTTNMPYVIVGRQRSQLEIITPHCSAQHRALAVELLQACITFVSLAGVQPNLYLQGGPRDNRSGQLNLNELVQLYAAEPQYQGATMGFWRSSSRQPNLHPATVARFAKQWMHDNNWPIAEVPKVIRYNINRQGELQL